jgi:probable H4MPT-linked C1 transfer pathway protein
VIVGLDIGGANLKAATATGAAVSRRFALYRQPERLPEELSALLASFSAITALAVTMTGELCDCYPSRAAGVLAILRAVETVAAGRSVRVYQTDGRLAGLDEARTTPLLSAASNWLALATVAARLAGPGPALLLDIGSTTTDIIPLLDGQPCPQGRTDPERLRSAELVYQGVRRTPVCSLLGTGGAAEFFATMHDVYLLLGKITPDATDTDTADGRSATVEAAHARLARMLLGDAETISFAECHTLATWLATAQRTTLSVALELVARRLPAPPETVVLSGSGHFLAKEIADTLGARQIDLGEAWGTERTVAACAVAVAQLAEEEAG